MHFSIFDKVYTGMGAYIEYCVSLGGGRKNAMCFMSIDSCISVDVLTVQAVGTLIILRSWVIGVIVFG